MIFRASGRTKLEEESAKAKNYIKSIEEDKDLSLWLYTNKRLVDIVFYFENGINALNSGDIKTAGVVLDKIETKLQGYDANPKKLELMLYHELSERVRELQEQIWANTKSEEESKSWLRLKKAIEKNRHLEKRK